MNVTSNLSLPQVARGAAQTVDLLLDFRPDEAMLALPRPPLNISLVLDRSGSMGGGRIRNAIAASKSLVDHLTDQDTLSVVSYDDHVRTDLHPTKVTDRSAAKKAIDRIRPGGLTNLSGGWIEGCDHVAGLKAAGAINRVLLLTDGQANRGTTDAGALSRIAREKAADQVITTTLGFGNGFNEDLLIGIAEACGGSFYFIQSNEDANGVFNIEVEGLASICAQNLEVHLELAEGVVLGESLHQLPTDDDDDDEFMELGDVYKNEGRQLAVELQLPALDGDGEVPLATVQYSYDVLVDGRLERREGEHPITIQVGDEDDVGDIKSRAGIMEQFGKLRIGWAKDEAVRLADSGDFAAATAHLREAIDSLRLSGAEESFEFAEEIEALDHYATMIEKRRYGRDTRKEIRDQSYQARSRNRSDLQLRGSSSGDTSALDAVTAAAGEEGEGVIVTCVRQGAKLRIHAVSDGYDSSFNVQFPRAIRQEGCSYLVEELVTASNGNFYRARGKIQLLLRPGQTRPAAPGASGGSRRRRSNPSLRAIKAPPSAASLPTTTEIGNGVLVQCVKEGRRSKLRARVVSDGYDPDLNMSFPRSVRELGVLYVVDEVRLASNGKSYRAYGSIKRLVTAAPAAPATT